jgi:hypothetical protein
MRRARPLLPREVGRRTDERHPEIRPDANSDHVLVHLLAKAHAGIVALGHDVGQAVVIGDLDSDIRISR